MYVSSENLIIMEYVVHYYPGSNVFDQQVIIRNIRQPKKSFYNSRFRGYLRNSLSPITFLLYINDLSQTFKSINTPIKQSTILIEQSHF